MTHEQLSFPVCVIDPVARRASLLPELNAALSEVVAHDRKVSTSPWKAFRAILGGDIVRCVRTQMSYWLLGGVLMQQADGEVAVPCDYVPISDSLYQRKQGADTVTVKCTREWEDL